MLCNGNLLFKTMVECDHNKINNKYHDCWFLHSIPKAQIANHVEHTTE